MNVAELAAKLKIDVDQASVMLAKTQLASVADQAKAVQTSTSTSEATTAGLVTGLQAQSQRADEDRAASAKAAADAADKAKSKTFDWAAATKKATLIAIAAMAVYRGAAGIGGMINATAEQAGAADDMAQKLGMSAEAVQEFAFAAKTNGTDISAVSSGMTKLTLAAKAATTGNDKAAKAFRAVGLNAKDVAKGTVPLDAAFMQIAERISSMEDGPEKLALSMQLLGKGGGELIPLLNQGADGLARLRKEAAESGYVIDNATSAALADFGDETDKVKMQLDGLRNQAIKAILPMLSELVKQIRQFISANREAIVATMAAALKLLLGIVTGLVYGFRALGAMIRFFAEHTGLAYGALVILIGVLAKLMLAATLAWGAVLGPILLLGLAIAGLIVYFDEIAAGVMWVFDKIGRAISKAVSGITSALGAVRRAFQAVGSAIRAVLTSISDAFRAVVDWIEDKIEWLVDKVKWVGDKLEGLRGAFDWIPGVDSGSSVASMSGSTSRSFAPVGGSSISVGDTTIQVNAPSADPVAVGEQVEQRLASFWDRQLRTAAANTGIA